MAVSTIIFIIFTTIAMVIVFLYTHSIELSNNLLFLYMLFIRQTFTFTSLILVSLIMLSYSIFFLVLRTPLLLSF